MAILLKIWEFFANNIMTKPELFMGLIVLVGYSMMRRPFHEILTGTIKAIVGYMILAVGSGGLVSTFRPILTGLNQRFGLQAAVMDPYFGQQAVTNAFADLGVTATYTMITLLIGFLVNIVLLLLRKLTKIRTLFLTGHVMVQQSTTVTWIIFLLIPSMRNMQGVLLIGLLMGVYWSVFANLTVEGAQEITDDAGFTVGHQNHLGLWLAYVLGPKVGNKEKSVDSVELPGWLSMFNDNVISSALLMMLFFGSIMVTLGEGTMRELDGSFAGNIAFPLYIFSKCLNFSVYLTILLTGVRMFVSELTESFRGISSKIKGAIPAVDVPALYGYSPNSVLIGFVSSGIGMFIATAGLIIFKSPVIALSGFVPMFFDGGAIACYANARGGFRAAVIIPFITGIITILGGAVATGLFGLYSYGGYHGNFDFATVWLGVGALVEAVKIPGIIITIVLMLIIPQVQYARTKKKDEYFVEKVMEF